MGKPKDISSLYLRPQDRALLTKLTAKTGATQAEVLRFGLFIVGELYARAEHRQQTAPVQEQAA